MSVRVKVKKTKLAEDKTISGAFNSILADNKSGLKMQYDKYLKVRESIVKFVRTMLLISNHDIFKLSEFDDEITIFRKYNAKHIMLLKSEFNVPDNILDLLEKDADGNPIANDETFSRLPENIQQNISTVIQNCSSLESVKSAILTGGHLANYVQFINDKTRTATNLRDEFLTTSPGSSLAPIEQLPVLDFKLIYNHSFIQTNEQKLEIIEWMTLINKSCIGVYEAISIPDIDVESFIRLLNKAIAQIEKYPEMSRCKQALAMIKNSVNLLRTNFNDYYKDFVGSSNPTIIMERYIKDVSSNSNADAVVISQFNSIIKLFNKMQQNMKQNGNTKSNKFMDTILGKLNQQVKSMTEEMPDYKEEPTSDDDDATTSPVAASTSATTATTASTATSATTASTASTASTATTSIDKSTEEEPDEDEDEDEDEDGDDDIEGTVKDDTSAAQTDTIANDDEAGVDDIDSDAEDFDLDDGNITEKLMKLMKQLDSVAPP